MFSLIFMQTVRLAFRKGGGALGTCAFYVIIMTLFTFALGPEVMKEHAGAAMCVALLLAIITALPMMYERDMEDGTLEQLLLQPAMLEFLVLAKIGGQWLANIVPIMLVSPLLAIMADVDVAAMLHALLLLLLASPSIVALGSIAAGLTLGNKRGGLLQALVIMPLYIPILIFASSQTGQGALLLLSGMLFAALPISCFVSAALIRMSVD